MERKIIEKLLAWKKKSNRKPLIIRGARQIGKTYILKEFGKNYYPKCAYINCDNNSLMKKIFDNDYNMSRVIRELSVISGINITPKDTLIILDEIQEIPKGLTSLKYFCEDAPDYHVVVAGSLLGLSLYQNYSFPVGKVDMMNMYPMSFGEFLLAMKKDVLFSALKKNDFEVINSVSNTLIDLLRQYYFVGGMPEAVKTYVKTQDVQQVREIQQNILDAYRIDVLKHAPKSEIQKIFLVFDNIVAQLAKDNKKFVLSKLKSGARLKDYEVAIQWLIDCGIVYKVCRTNKAELPLNFYQDANIFKLYFVDCGLMGALSQTPAQKVLLGENVFVEYKGAFTENFVLQQLKSANKVDAIFYYTNDNSTLELDYLVQKEEKIIPVEVKAEQNLRSKSLQSFLSKNPTLNAVKFSMQNYIEQERIINVPLACVEFYNF